MLRHVRVEGGWLKVGSHEFNLEKIGDIIVVGGGKAGAAMTEAWRRS
jgi:NADPH-dependent 2,4-dienoyl-CoA reductase/sulfur reductase-like enzyme